MVHVLIRFLIMILYICIEVPEEEKGPFMTFAASSTSSKSDIECQVVPSSFESIAIDQCLTLSNRCGGRSDESIYTDSIKICNIFHAYKHLFSKTYPGK